MEKRKNRKVWGFIVVWLILFLVVKSIEKILYITAVAALIYWGSRMLKGPRNKGDNGGGDIIR